MDHVQAVLQKAAGQLEAAATLYGADLELQRVSPTLRGKIRAFLESERGALDHLAQRLVTSGGGGAAEARYPLASDEGAFSAELDEAMPGLRERRPEVAAAVARHQPFAVAALAHLRVLLLDEKRQRLTPETRPAPKAQAVEPAVEPATEPAEPAPAPPHLPPGAFGAGLTGPLVINGADYDPVTLQPMKPPPKQERTSIYVAWRFEGADTSALETLHAVQAAVAAAVADISTTAGL